jgi:rhodanese-related sulfurtransferase
MIYHITAAELRAKQKEDNVLLLDVREPYEHAEFNIGGDLIPLDEIMSHSEQIPRDKPVIVYCKKGIRSQIAIQRLQDKFGFSNLVNLKGGLEAWKKEI